MGTMDFLLNSSVLGEDEVCVFPVNFILKYEIGKGKGNLEPASKLIPTTRSRRVAS